MKQKLFVLASMAAVLASCTNDDFLTQEQNTADLKGGIVFKIADEATTRGEFNTDEAGKFFTSWNAETDRMSVVYFGAKKGATDATTLWCGVSGAVRDAEVGTPVDIASTELATYKTTRSGLQGWVTAASDADILTFADKATAPNPQITGSFRVFRPAMTTGNIAYTRTAEGVESMKVPVAAFNTQTQATEKAAFENFFMVSEPLDGVYSDKNAVGESLELSFERPFAALAVRTSGYDSDIYGNLNKVKVTMTQSNIAYSDETTVDVAGKVNGKWAIGTGTGAKAIELTVGEGSGLEWSDDYYAFIQILPVDRSSYKASEDYTVELTFANGTIVVEKATTNSWAANSFVKITADLENKPYTYLATGNKLIVNSAMPTLDASNKFDGKIAANSVTTFVSNIALTEAQLKTLKEKFTEVTTMTLANQSADLGNNLANLKAGITSLTLTAATTAPKITSYAGLTTLSCPAVKTIPAGAYEKNTVITKFSFPKVETIGDNAFDGATNVTTIGCANTDKLIIGTTNATTKVKTSALTTIGSFAFANIPGITSVDAPAVTTMGARAFGNTALASVTSVLMPKYNFAIESNATALLGGAALAIADISAVEELSLAGVCFTGNTALTTVTLKEGVKIGKSAFAGCSTLATVNKLDKAASIGDNAFSGTELTKALVNVETIGAGAFKECASLATVTLGANVKNIGEAAFNGCTALATVNNLANVETIGKEAFKSAIINTFDYVGATLAEGAFQSCTELKGNVRSNVTTLEKNVFNGANKVSNFIFPNVTTIKEGALAELMNSTPYATVTFGAALTSISAKAFATPSAATAEKDGSTVEKAIETTTPVNCNLIITDKTGLTVKEKAVTYKADDNKYYKFTFQSVQ